jgi:hypothetical protein
VFVDWPFKNGGAVSAQLDHIRFDGSTFLKTLKNQKDTLFEAGYLIPKTKFQPVVQIAQRNFSDGGGVDENRYAAGLNYFISGHNANVKALYSKIELDNVQAANQFTVQIQFFYY